jgi:hypothetical protein
VPAESELIIVQGVRRQSLDHDRGLRTNGHFEIGIDGQYQIGANNVSFVNEPALLTS